MKFKIELELDTNDDKEIGAELIDLVGLLKNRLDAFNSEASDEWDEEEYEEEIEAEEPEPKPKRKYRRRNNK